MNKYIKNSGSSCTVNRCTNSVFLKKDAIYTVALSALQEVNRQPQAERARNDSLEARIWALETGL